MPADTNGNSLVIFAVLIFVSVSVLAEGLYLLWKNYRGAEARKLSHRMNAFVEFSDRQSSANLLKGQNLSDLPSLQRLLLGRPRVERLGAFVAQSGVRWNVSQLALASAALAFAGFILPFEYFRFPGWIALWVAVIAASVPFSIVGWRRSKRLARMESQLPDALDLLTRALRSGHAFSSALQMVGQEMPEPIAGEFRFAHDEVNFGVSLEEALGNLARRVPVTDLGYFVVSVLVQRESGGNLTEILTNLSRLIRDRLKFTAKVRVLSADGRLSAWVLGILPFALAGLMNLFNPSFMKPLWTDPFGIAILKVLAVLMFLGVIVLKKLTRIRV